MSGRWPGWRTLPGIEIAPMAEKAREQGSPWHQYSYVWDAPEHNYVTTCGWDVDAGGTITIPGDGWEPVIEDGMLTGFRALSSGRLEELVQISAVVIPEGTPPWSPCLTARLPAEQIGPARRGDSMADGIDLSEDGPASVTIGFPGADGGMTMVTWAVTSESAASVIALIRERHGEPTAEFAADAGHAAALHKITASGLAAHTVMTCSHEEPT